MPHVRRLELTSGEGSGNQGLIARFYGSNECISVLASSKSRTPRIAFVWSCSVLLRCVEKYRFQGDTLAGIWLFCHLFLERMKSSSSTIEFEFGDPLPFNDYFVLIDRHYELRVECEQINAALDTCSKQFRAIQKRLLNKFKDKTPTLLDNLDVLLENTNQQVRSFWCT